MNDSHIGVTDGRVTSFVGKDAVSVFAATAVIGGMRMFLRCGMLANRAYTPQAMRDFTARVTGKHYARSRKGLETAMADLTKWRDEMRDALPVIDNKTGEQL